MNRFQFVEDHKDAYGVKRLCEVVEVARSSFSAWLDSAGKRAAKATDDAVLAARVNHKRVARVMREHRLAGIRLRRRVKTMIPDQSARGFPDLIGRGFSVGVAGRRYVGDITYLPIADGTILYLASCIDLGSRKLAGWQVADHMRAGLVEDALRAAHRDRGSLAGATPRSATSVLTPTKPRAPLRSRKLHNRTDTVSTIKGQGPPLGDL